MPRALIEDTNNKPGEHVTKNDYWASIGREVTRCKLPYGDYILAPPVVVDTKKDIDELAGNLISDHRRFRDAAIKAMSCGSHMVILVENREGITDLDSLERDWCESDSHFAMRRRRAEKSGTKAERRTGERIAKICRTMEERYFLEFQFCSPEEAGQRVLEILGEVV